MDHNYASLNEHVNGLDLLTIQLWFYGLGWHSLAWYSQPGERKHSVKIKEFLYEKKMKEEWKS